MPKTSASAVDLPLPRDWQDSVRDAFVAAVGSRTRRSLSRVAGPSTRGFPAYVWRLSAIGFRLSSLCHIASSSRVLLSKSMPTSALNKALCWSVVDFDQGRRHLPPCDPAQNCLTSSYDQPDDGHQRHETSRRVWGTLTGGDNPTPLV